MSHNLNLNHTVPLNYLNRLKSMKLISRCELSCPHSGDYAAHVCLGADYCKKLKEDRAKMQKEMEGLKQEIESLNSAIRWVRHH